MSKLVSKKGILFTLGLTFLVLVVLALAVLIFHSAQKSEEIIAKLAVLDRVYDLDISIEQSLRDIFNLKSGILINITDNSIIFEEELPNSNAGSFNSSMKAFKNFVESNFANINISIDEIISQVPLAIMPYDITYKHVDFGDRIIEVIPKQINFDGYSVFMFISENVSSCDYDIEEEGGFSFSIEVIGPNGESCSDSMLIDPSEENEVEINDGAVKIEVEDNILSVIIDEESIDANVKIRVIGASSAYIEYPPVIVYIDFGEFGVYKESKVRLE